jgi:hypothetical protein
MVCFSSSPRAPPAHALTAAPPSSSSSVPPHHHSATTPPLCSCHGASGIAIASVSCGLGGSVVALSSGSRAGGGRAGGDAGKGGRLYLWGSPSPHGIGMGDFRVRRNTFWVVAVMIMYRLHLESMYRLRRRVAGKLQS